MSEKRVNEPKALWVKIGIVFGDSSLNAMEHHNASYRLVYGTALTELRIFDTRVRK